MRKTVDNRAAAEGEGEENMNDATPRVRLFDIANSRDRANRLGESGIFIAAAVEQTEGGPLSAYSAHFDRGERAELPAPYEEVWVVVRGLLSVRSAGTVVTVGEGQFVHVPRKSPGEVEALEDASLVCVSVPAH